MLKSITPNRIGFDWGLEWKKYRSLPVICYRLGIPTAIYYNDEAIHLLQETPPTGGDRLGAFGCGYILHLAEKMDTPTVIL